MTSPPAVDRVRRLCLLLAPILYSGRVFSQDSPQLARSEAGSVDLVEGTVTIVGADRSRRTPRVGDKLFEGDSVVTARNGELHADMVDGGVLAIRPDTQMRIVRYQANGEATDSAILGLLKGSFRSITGWIGKTNPSGYQIRTPTATVGVRGTDHEPLVIPQGSTEGEPGTYDRVHAGGSYIQSPRGRVDVDSGRAGFFAHHGRDAPRVLGSVPGFFRPTRNESRLQGRHERVLQRMEALRTERRRLLRERGVTSRPGNAGQREPAAERNREQRAAREAERERQREERRERQQERREQRQERGEQRHERGERQAPHNR